MNKTFFSVFTIVSLLFSVFVVLPVSSTIIETNEAGNTLYVGGYGTGNYTKIQDAIDNASNGDTIYVYNGTYYENILIETDNISLIGEDKDNTIIDGQNNGNSVLILNEHIVFKNFKIIGSGQNNYHAGIVIQADECNISNNIIENNYNGILISGLYNNITKNLISNNINGIFISGPVNFITKNLIYNHKDGSGLIVSSYDAYIRNNNVTGNFYGIYIINNRLPNNFIKNKVSYNNFGLYSDKPSDTLYDECPNIFYQNNFIHNKNIKYFYENKNVNWNNNYWSNWIGINYLFLEDIPYIISGTPRIYLIDTFIFIKIFSFNIDHNPAKEPFDIDFGGME